MSSLINLHRHEFDSHVISPKSDLHNFYWRIVGRVNDYEQLINIISSFSPSANLIEQIRYDKILPSEIVIDKLGQARVDSVAHERRLSRIQAAGHILLHDQHINPDLLFLRAIPPITVHAMQRGDFWFGDIYSSDLVISSLSSIDFALAKGMTILDYGGSSGSLVRILSAVYPDVKFAACDPVKSSIDWAKNNLKRSNLTFYHQHQEPPLPFMNNEFDVITAISIWSHHGVNAAGRWFDEIFRILKPGGILVFTAHGAGSIQYYTEQALKPLIRFKELYTAYLATGVAFEEVWIDSDDVGNTATSLEWGHSYYDPKIIAVLLHDKFRIEAAYLRANQANQDVYVVRKKQ